MMATSRRRSRRQSGIDDDDDDVIEGLPQSPSTERTSSTPELRAEKRRRTTENSADTSTGSVEDVEIDEGIEYGDIEEDEDEEENEEEQEMRAAATQRQAEVREEQEREREAGDVSEVIKSIELFNFMCHKRLEINFGSRINFIIGHNGSGKSAILTALTICLGAKANATNRGSSLKSLIKEGENSATIIVKILNGGKDPYKPELYGDVIAIERRFSRDATSGYKIKSSTGHVVSTKREELQEILDHIQLQVDNPMTVLTQDTARQFLGNSSVGEKYKLFMRGVQLSQLDTDYSMVEGQVSAMEATIKSKVESLEILKELEREAKNRLQVFERSAAIQEKVQKLQNHFVWSQYKAQEEIVEANEKEIKRVLARIESAKQRVDTYKTEREEQDIRVEAANDANQAHLNQETNLKLEADQASKAVQESRQRLQTFLADQKQIEGAVKLCEDNIKDHEGKIKEERQREENGDKRLELQEKLAQLDIEINEWTAQSLESTAAATRLELDVKVNENKGKDIRRQRDDIRKLLAERKNGFHELTKSKTSKLSVYHKNMPAVMVEIQRRKNEFKEIPIGPLGVHVKILESKEQWADICENIFGRALNGFLVTNYEDLKVLQGILDKKDCSVPILMSKRDLFDFSAGEPDQKYDTVLRILDITDEFVKRQLIVQNHIESTILIENRKEADREMYKRPKNVFACYALNPHLKGHGYKVGGAYGGSGIAPVKAWNSTRRLTNMSVDDQIEEAEAELREIQTQSDTLDRDVIRTTAQVQNIRKELRQARSMATEAETSRQRATDKAETMREELALQQPDSGRVVAYEEVIEQAKEEKKTLLGQLVALRTEQQEAVNAHAPLEEAKKKKRKALDNLQKEIKRTADVFTEETHKRMQITTNIRHHEDQIKDSQKNYEAAVAENEGQRLKLEEIHVAASKYCPVRVPNEEIKESTSVLRAKMDALKEQITRMQDLAGITEGEAQDKFQEARDQYRGAKHEMESLETLKAALIQSLNERRDRYYKFRHSISYKAKEVFVHLLGQRGYHGRLIIDHEKQEIRVKVNPAGSERGTRKDPKSLSGGEKSFTQVCMLLSVWEAMGSPIRALDEFDVFMDAVNRKTSMAMMIESARASVAKQFILITPQDMGNVAMGPDIRVHRMRDPERGQGVIESA